MKSFSVSLLLLLPSFGTAQDTSNLRGQSERQLQYDPTVLPWDLPEGAKDWCLPPTEPPLDYYQCYRRDIVAKALLPWGSGMGSTFNHLTNMCMWAMANGICFYVDEGQTVLKSEGVPSFIDRYFEPIGIPAESHMIQEAKEANEQYGMPQIENYFIHADVEEYAHAETKSSPALGLYDINRWEIKSLTLRRMWRWLPSTREAACGRLAAHNFGSQEFLTLSVRRGDKALEAKTNVHGVEVTPMEDYITFAEEAIQDSFGGVVPKIFVATDDCSVLPELEHLRPTWEFVSECPSAQEEDDRGYHLKDMATWDQEELDAHFHKFFVELMAMVSAKIFIGVPYTNVSYLVYYMRQKPQSTFRLIKGNLEQMW